MNYATTSKLYGFVALVPHRLTLLLALFIAALFTGCESQRSATGLGSVAGIANLSQPDAATGHAGILVYLAGTPYQARTDQQGRYRIDGIPAGTYDLIAEKERYQGQIIEGLTIDPDVHRSGSPLQPANTLLTTVPGPAPVTASGADYGTITGEVLLDGMPDDNGGVRVEVNGSLQP